MKPTKLLTSLLAMALLNMATLNAQTKTASNTGKKVDVKQATTKTPTATAQDDDLLVPLHDDLLVPLTSPDDDLLVPLHDDLLVPLTKETKPTTSLSNEQIRELMKKYWYPIENDMDKRRKHFESTQSYVVKRKKVLPGELDFIGVFDKIPLPAASLGTAFSSYCNNEGPYTAFSKNLETIAKRFGEQILANSSSYKLSNKGQAAVEKEAIKQAQQSPIMNGIDVEKLAKMSESERAKYAEQMKSQVMHNVSQIQQQGMGGDAEVMAIMSNKNLSQTQKEAAVKALMARRVEENKKKPVTPKSEQEMIAENAGFEKSMKEVRDGRFQQQANILMSATVQALGLSESRFIKVMNSINQAEDIFAKRMGKWYQAAYDALPITVVGENAEKDPTQLDATSKKIHQEFADRMLAMKAKAVEQYKMEAKYAVGKFHDFMGDFKPDQHQASNPFNDIVMQVGQGGELILAFANKIASESSTVAGYGCGQGKFYLSDKKNDCNCLSKKTN
jgi:hypothetical protein